MMSSESNQGGATSITSSNNQTQGSSGIPQFAQQQMQSLPLGRQASTSLGHSSSPAVRPASDSADTEVLQTSEGSAPAGRRPFTHVLLSRPIKSEPADDDIAIVGQTMARAPVNQVRFIQPQVISHQPLNSQLQMGRQILPQGSPQLLQHAHPPPGAAQRMSTSVTMPQATVVGSLQQSSPMHIRPQLSQPRAIAPGPPNNSVIRLVRTHPQGASAISMVRAPPPAIAPQYVTRGSQPLIGQPPAQPIQQIVSQNAAPSNQATHSGHRVGPTGITSGNNGPSSVATGGSTGGGSGGSSGTSQGTEAPSDGFPGVHARLTSVDRLLNSLTGAHRFLDNRSVLNHEDLVELYNADRLLSSLSSQSNQPSPNECLSSIFQKDGGPFRCVECVDTFATQEAYNGHRERNSVEINYDCDHCERVRSFGNKCALFSHVRGHRKGSIDPTRLKIRIVVNGRRTSNQVMRRHLDTVRERLEKYAVNVREAKDAETATKTVIEKHEALLREARAKLKEIEESTSLEEPMNTSEAVGLSLGHQQHRSTEPAAAAVTYASGVADDVSKTIEKLVPERTGTVLEKKTGIANTDNKKCHEFIEDIESSGETVPCELSNGGDLEHISTAAPEEGDGSVKCIFCKERFRNAASLRKHFVGSELSSGRSDVSDPSSAAATGGQNASTSIQTNCPLCRMMVHSGPTLCALKAHLLFHLDAGRVCPDCGFIATDSDELKAEVTMRRHLHTACLHFQQVYVNLCTFCPEEEQRAYHNPSQLAGHVKQAHCQRLFQCTVCEQSLENEYAWQRHLVTVHHVQASAENRRVLFQCPVCSQQIRQREGALGRTDSVRSHIEHHCTENEHSLTEAYRCFAQCKQIFYDQGSLRDHMKTCSNFTSMPPIVDDKLPCLLCLRVNSHHLRSGDRSFNQAPRQQIFSVLSMLRTHERSHLRWTTLASTSSILHCPWCRTELNLSNRNESESHLNEHAKSVLSVIASEGTPDDAPDPPTWLFTCHCGFQVNSLFDLSSHLTTTSHPVVSEEQRGTGTLVQPVTCTDCGEKYHRRSQLIDHIYAQHPSLCYFCNSFHAGSRAELPSHLWSCLGHAPRISDLGTAQVFDSVQRSSHDCPRCAESFFSHADMLGHLYKAHAVETRAPCLLCECLFTSMEALKHHTQTAHAQAVMGGAGALRCWHCPKTFEKRAALERHVVSAHKVSRQDMENSRALKRDAQEDDESKDFGSEGVKRVRLLKRNGNFTDMYECANCVFATKDRPAFLQHVGRWHRTLQNGSSASVLQCPECGLCFATQLPLCIHLTAVHKITRSNCQSYIKDHWFEIVGSGIEIAKEKTDLIKPRRQQHEDVASSEGVKSIVQEQMEDNGAKMYSCSSCKVFKTDNLDILKKHERTHGLHFIKTCSGVNQRPASSSPSTSQGDAAPSK